MNHSDSEKTKPVGEERPAMLSNNNQEPVDPFRRVLLRRGILLAAGIAAAVLFTLLCAGSEKEFLALPIIWIGPLVIGFIKVSRHSYYYRKFRKRSNKEDYSIEDYKTDIVDHYKNRYAGKRDQKRSWGLK